MESLMVWGFGMLTKKSWDTLTFRSQIKISSPFQFSPTFNKSQAIWKQKNPFKISRKKVVLVFLVTSNLPTIFSRLNPPFLFLRTGHYTQKNKGLNHSTPASVGFLESFVSKSRLWTRRIWAEEMDGSVVKEDLERKGSHHEKVLRTCVTGPTVWKTIRWENSANIHDPSAKNEFSWFFVWIFFVRFCFGEDFVLKVKWGDG